MARIDYLNDPDAPKANSVVPAVSAIVTDTQDRILLILRTDNGYWSIPGGGLNPGESVAAATVREVKEETGIDCQVTGLVGIYSDPNHVAAYDNGEVRQEFSICLTTRMTGGTTRLAANPPRCNSCRSARFLISGCTPRYGCVSSIFSKSAQNHT